MSADSVINENRIECEPENAARFYYWAVKRGGVAHWKSIDLSDLDHTMSSPRFDKEGNEITKPHWKVDDKPAFVVTDLEKIFVVVRKEVRRFHIAVRMGSQGFSVKLTDASSRKLKNAIKAVNANRSESDATYYFDYGSQEAVIEVPEKLITLKQWAEDHVDIAPRCLEGDPAALGY